MSPTPTVRELLEPDILVADWERRIPYVKNILPYSVPSDPQYWVCFMRFAPPTFLLTGNVKSRSRINVTYSATIAQASSNVNTVGFLGAQLIYFFGGGYDFPITQPSFDEGNNIPSFVNEAFTGLVPVGSDSYDPVALPIGGANFPIWTRQSTDPITVTTYVQDSDNPGNLWALCYIQINDSLNETSACTVIQRMRWDPVDDSDKLVS